MSPVSVGSILQLNASNRNSVFHFERKFRETVELHFVSCWYRYAALSTSPHLRARIVFDNGRSRPMRARIGIMTEPTFLTGCSTDDFGSGASYNVVLLPRSDQLSAHDATYRTGLIIGRAIMQLSPTIPLRSSDVEVDLHSRRSPGACRRFLLSQ